MQSRIQKGGGSVSISGNVKVQTLDTVKTSLIQHGIKFLFQVLRNFSYRKKFCSNFSENFLNFSRKNCCLKKNYKFLKSNILKNSPVFFFFRYKLFSYEKLI